MHKSLWRGSTIQSLAIIILPLTIVLVAVTFVSFSIHQNAMRAVVGERDERSAQSAASAIDTEINHRLASVQGLALISDENPQGNPADILALSDTLVGGFDFGTAIVDQGGAILAATGDQVFWQRLSRGENLISALDRAAVANISPVFLHPETGGQVVLIAVQLAEGGRWAVGAFSPETLIQRTLQEAYPSDGSTSTYVIDEGYQVLYHSGPATMEGAPNLHPGVSEAFQGQSGTTYMKVGRDEHVVAYSPIPSVGWAIVTEESWEMVSNPTLRASQIIPLVLVPALLLAMMALWFGSQQIVRPLQTLESRAAKLAWGDFQEIEKPVGGIAEIRDLQDELVHMAHQVQASQKSLHGYIGAITKGQEAERLRLARELHDDTIQSLIALKQRVQLARIIRKGSPAPEMEELVTLIEHTIEDLRRTTRALRPIYLEDLGLVAALEMLVRETGQGSRIQVEFQSSGSERRLPAEVELALYRMAQEALNNAVHHSQANRIALLIEFNTSDATLQISDNGKGFDVPKVPAEFASQGHFGLLGLFERADLIGAHLEIASAPSKGTSVVIRLPS